MDGVNVSLDVNDDDMDRLDLAKFGRLHTAITHKNNHHLHHLLVSQYLPLNPHTNTGTAMHHGVDNLQGVPTFHDTPTQLPQTMVELLQLFKYHNLGQFKESCWQ